MKRQVFYSFHFDNDVMRVQQIRNMRDIAEWAYRVGGTGYDHRGKNFQRWIKARRSGAESRQQPGEAGSMIFSPFLYSHRLD